MQWTDRIGRRLKLQDMHILLATVQWGSMAKAADRLAISQPVVSRSIGSLEQTLGVRLLDRSRTGVEPTMYGRALLAHGLAAFNELRQGVKAIEFLADPTAGELRIGASEPTEAGLLAAIIDRLSRQYPRLTFHVIQGEQHVQNQALRTRTIDLTIGRLPATVSAPETETEVLLHERAFVVGGVALVLLMIVVSISATHFDLVRAMAAFASPCEEIKAGRFDQYGLNPSG